MFRKMPFILLGLIALVVCVDPFLPLQWKSCAFALSLSIKSIIMFLLPAVIFALLFKTAANLAKKATGIIILLLLIVCCSNFFSTFLSYLVGKAVYHSDFSIAFPQTGEGLLPAWSFALPQWISNAHAMFAGVVAGIAMSRFFPERARKLSSVMSAAVDKILYGVIAIMPFFIGGFVLKLSADGLMGIIVRDYAVIFIVIAAAQFSYIAFLYLAANRFRWGAFLQSIKNMLPAGIAGFGTMSSAAAMPLTLIGAGKNSRRPEFARAIIPATVNIHLIGDCFAIPIFAFAVLKNFGVAEPAIGSYLIFALYFVMAKFSVAAIPGGGILVMLPILEGYLGFNGEMMSLITALYILFDPVITCANIMGNGAFSTLVSQRYVFVDSVEEIK